MLSRSIRQHCQVASYSIGDFAKMPPSVALRAKARTAEIRIIVGYGTLPQFHRLTLGVRCRSPSCIDRYSA